MVDNHKEIFGLQGLILLISNRGDDTYSAGLWGLNELMLVMYLVLGTQPFLGLFPHSASAFLLTLGTTVHVGYKST